MRFTHDPKSRLFTLLCLASLVLPGCASTVDRLSESLQHENPAIRVRAIRDIAETDEQQLLPQLVEALDDSDSAVRFYAILALEKMTGTRRGYAYTDPPWRRRVAIESWRTWVRGSDHAESIE